MSDRNQRYYEAVTASGVPILDHIFETSSAKKISYRGSSPGGTVGNVLVNLAWHGETVAFVGETGSDEAASLARGFYSAHGVDVGGLAERSGSTHVIVQSWRDEGLETRHSFGGSCPTCGAELNSRRTVRYVKGSRRPPAESGSGRPNVCLVDRLTAGAREHLRSGASGDLRVLDLGRLGFLRYKPATEWLHFLQDVDVLFIPEKVATSICRRAGIESTKELGTFGPSLVVVTRGERGLSFYVKREGKIVAGELFGARDADLVDDAGAGDALVAGFLLSLVRSGVPLGLTTPDEVGGYLSLGIELAASSLGGIGAVGHLSPLCRLDIGELAVRPHDPPECPLVPIERPGSSRAPSRKAGIQRNVSMLLNRALFAGENHRSAAELREFCESSEGTLTVVGTGGSYSAAWFLADLAAEHAGLVASAVHPRNYVMRPNHSDSVLGVSYSGRTREVVEALRVSLERNKRAGLVTGADPLRVSAPGVRLVSFGSPGKSRATERGFVSVAGTVAPCAMALAGFAGAGELVRVKEAVEFGRGQWRDVGIEVGRALLRGDEIHCFYDSMTYPASVDLESKFAEGGLGPLVLHEVKDFSHGRFISFSQSRLDVSRGQTLIVLKSGAASLYLDGLLRRMRQQVSEDRVHEVALELTRSSGALEALIAVQYVVAGIAETVERDLSRPSDIPRRFLELYRWKRSLD